MLLGTGNLENLYRPGGRYGPKDETEYKTKLASLAAVVTDLDPALLGVQEVGEPEALEDLATMLDGEWHIALSGHPDGRGIRVGVLSRARPRVVADVNAFPERLHPIQADDSGPAVLQTGRGFLAVEVTTEAGVLTTAVAHLRSKLLTYPGGRFFPHDEGERARHGAYALYRRAAEAAALRALADRLLDGDGRTHDVAVLGDLNDEVLAATPQILLGPPGSEIGTPGYDAPDGGDAARLWNVAPLIPVERRWSRISFGRRELIDHILAGHRLVYRITAAGTGLPDDGALLLPSVHETPAERRGTPGSDHAPVWARVDPV